jgi:hypothetical protein
MSLIISEPCVSGHQPMSSCFEAKSRCRKMSDMARPQPMSSTLMASRDLSAAASHSVIRLSTSEHYLAFFLSFFTFRFSLRLNVGFFWASFFPLSFFPFSPMVRAPGLHGDVRGTATPKIRRLK